MREINTNLPDERFPFDTDSEAEEAYGQPFNEVIKDLYDKVCNDICCTQFDNVSDCNECPVGCLITQASQYDESFWKGIAGEVRTYHENRKKKLPKFYEDMPEMYPENNIWEQILSGGEC